MTGRTKIVNSLINAKEKAGLSTGLSFHVSVNR